MVKQAPTDASKFSHKALEGFAADTRRKEVTRTSGEIEIIASGFALVVKCKSLTRVCP